MTKRPLKPKSELEKLVAAAVKTVLSNSYNYKGVVRLKSATHRTWAYETIPPLSPTERLRVADSVGVLQDLYGLE